MVLHRYILIVWVFLSLPSFVRKLRIIAWKIRSLFLSNTILFYTSYHLNFIQLYLNFYTHTHTHTQYRNNIITSSCSRINLSQSSLFCYRDNRNSTFEPSDFTVQYLPKAICRNNVSKLEKSISEEDWSHVPW